MNALSFRELVAPATRATPRYETMLRSAALTVSRSDGNAIAASTVLGVLGLDDVPEFQAQLAAIADEFRVEANLQLMPGSFSVRFTR